MTEQPSTDSTDLHRFKVGDRVQWTVARTSRGGNHITFNVRRGAIHQIIGDMIYVKRDGRSRAELIHHNKLKPEQDVGGPLTELLFAMAGQPLPEHLRSSAQSAVKPSSPPASVPSVPSAVKKG